MWKLGFEKSVARGKKKRKEKQIKSYQSKVPKHKMLWKTCGAAEVLPPQLWVQALQSDPVGPAGVSAAVEPAAGSGMPRSSPG